MNSLLYWLFKYFGYSLMSTRIFFFFSFFNLNPFPHTCKNLSSLNNDLIPPLVSHQKIHVTHTWVKALGRDSCCSRVRALLLLRSLSLSLRFSLSVFLKLGSAVAVVIVSLPFLFLAAASSVVAFCLFCFFALLLPW